MKLRDHKKERQHGFSLMIRFSRRFRGNNVIKPATSTILWTSNLVNARIPHPADNLQTYKNVINNAGQHLSPSKYWWTSILTLMPSSFTLLQIKFIRPAFLRPFHSNLCLVSWTYHDLSILKRALCNNAYYIKRTHDKYQNEQGRTNDLCV